MPNQEADNLTGLEVVQILNGALEFSEDMMW